MALYKMIWLDQVHFVSGCKDPDYTYNEVYELTGFWSSSFHDFCCQSTNLSLDCNFKR